MADGGRELTAAGITDERLRTAYLHSREVHAEYGRSYFLATRMLPRARRPHVHALYGFARYADEIVDRRADLRSPTRKAVALERLGAALARAIDRAAGTTTDPGATPLMDGGTDAEQLPVLTAVAHTVHRYGLDRSLFEAFLAAMRMDTEVAEYPDRAALRVYMHGSAGVIGLQLLPVLGTVGPPAEAATAAEALGIAFQLTNFLRDVGEDLDRGRVYLPMDELASFGVDRALLTWCRLNGKADPQVRTALAHLVDSTRALYAEARPGIELLAPESRHCVLAAFSLYSAILDEIVSADYDVLDRRVTVSRARRIALAAPGMVRAYAVRTARTGEPARTPSPERGV